MVDKALRQAGSERLRQWWDEWRADDYTWSGLGAFDEDGRPKRPWLGWVWSEAEQQAYKADGASEALRKCPATLQHYWITQCRAQGRELDELLIRNRRTREVYTIVHLPLTWSDGEETGKEALSEEVMDLINTCLANAGEARFKMYASSLAWTDDRAQLAGAVIPATPRWVEGKGVHADFTQACFLDDLDWRNRARTRTASFRNVQFSRSIFTKSAIFSRSTFEEMADFSRCAFLDFVWFQNAKLSDSADFSAADFFGSVAFSDASFGSYTNFSKSVFSSFANFERATFTGSVDLSDTMFAEGARFADADFQSASDFHAARFSQGAGFARVRFVGNARFAKADFMDNVSFDRATFMSLSVFRNAAFLKHAVFTHVAFRGETDFSRSTLHQPIFNDATFMAKVNLEGLACRDVFRFSNVSSLKEMSFEGAKFAGQAIFRGGAFSGPMKFATTVFSGEVAFSDSKFHDEADFQEVRFQQAAAFENADFGQTSCFTAAAFSKAARFGGAAFIKDAVFTRTIFNEDVLFEGAAFAEASHFDSASFCGDALFLNAHFEGPTSFRGTSQPVKAPDQVQSLRFAPASTGDGAVEGQIAQAGDLTPLARRAFLRFDAEGAVFVGDADFGNREFLSESSFAGAVFLGLAKFHGARLHQRLSLHRAEFRVLDYEAARPRRPWFGFAAPSLWPQPSARLRQASGIEDAGEWERQAILARSTALDAARAQRKTKLAQERDGASSLSKDQVIHLARDTRYEEIEAAFRTLKQAMEDNRARRMESHFFKLELQARRERRSDRMVPRWEQLISEAYGAASDYGDSVVRPLGCLALLWLAFGIAYWLLAPLASGATFVPLDQYPRVSWVPLDGLGDALQYSLGRTSLFGAFSGKDESWPWFTAWAKHPSLWSLSGVIRILAMIQSFLAVILTFLFALAIRRKFQIT